MKLTQEQKKVRDIIRKNNLYLVLSINSTNRVLKGRFYYISKGLLYPVNNKEYKSSVIGMRRSFDLFCQLCNDYELDQHSWEYTNQYDKNNNCIIKYKKPNSVSQNYIVLGE